jgi:tellurite resistance protein
MSQTISHHAGLVYIMVIVSAADGRMTDAELKTIGEIVQKFPIFNDFSADRLVPVAEECGAILTEEGGLDAVLGLIKESIPDKLRETAYAVAVEVAVADEKLEQEELRLLELLRDALSIERLYAGAIERSARARHMTL